MDAVVEAAPSACAVLERIRVTPTAPLMPFGTCAGDDLGGITGLGPGLFSLIANFPTPPAVTRSSVRIVDTTWT